MRPLGRTRIQRLLFLASQSPALRKPCSEAALHLITSSTKDVNAYHQALALRNTTAHHDQAALPRDQRLPADTAWIESTERSNRAESQKLDLELRNYTNNLIKESIRVSVLSSVWPRCFWLKFQEPPDGTQRSGRPHEGNGQSDRCAQVLHEDERLLQHERRCRRDVHQCDRGELLLSLQVA